MQVPRFQPGILTDDMLNALVELANRADILGSGALQVTPGGLYVEPCREFSALKLTGGGTSGLYDWTRVLPVATAPYWEDTTDTGTGAGDEPAAEINGDDGIDTTNTPVVWAWREPGVAGWRFAGRPCP